MELHGIVSFRVFVRKTNVPYKYLLNNANFDTKLYRDIINVRYIFLYLVWIVKITVNAKYQIQINFQ